MVESLLELLAGFNWISPTISLLDQLISPGETCGYFFAYEDLGRIKALLRMRPDIRIVRKWGTWGGFIVEIPAEQESVFNAALERAGFRAE